MSNVVYLLTIVIELNRIELILAKKKIARRSTLLNAIFEGHSIRYPEYRKQLDKEKRLLQIKKIKSRRRSFYFKDKKSIILKMKQLIQRLKVIE